MELPQGQTPPNPPSAIARALGPGPPVGRCPSLSGHSFSAGRASCVLPCSAPGA
ncbi:hypothetical protein B0T17DRAFT_560820 [Bombardia bombarda]|uniref:Uncharacterized protein n=1 Tax=Bombardia bombarda TaxID=252184 RepID=A0AA40BY78_9PEZI|nr:hypothetical protein B0T17DRAFT_560820 [Bombardia bombarda]